MSISQTLGKKKKTLNVIENLSFCAEMIITVSFVSLIFIEIEKVHQKDSIYWLFLGLFIFYFHLNPSYNQVRPSEKHWPAFWCWSLPCSKSCIPCSWNLSFNAMTKLSHTIIKSKNWNAEKYMMVLTRVSWNFWKFISVKEKNF